RQRLRRRGTAQQVRGDFYAGTKGAEFAQGVERQLAEPFAMISVGIVRIPSAAVMLRKQPTGVLIQRLASSGQPFPVSGGYIVDPVLHLGQPHVLSYLRARAAVAHVAPLPSAVVDHQPLDMPLQLRGNETANRLIDSLLTGMHLAQTGVRCGVPFGAAQVV